MLTLSFQDRIYDLAGIFAYSLEDCLYACSKFSDFMTVDQLDVVVGAPSTGWCQSVTWRVDMADANTTLNANCWLKNGTTLDWPNDNCVSARLMV